MIKTDIVLKYNFKESDIIAALEVRLGISREEIIEYKIIRSQLDFSDKSNIVYKLSVAISVSAERECGLLKMRKKIFPYERLEYTSPISRLKARPVVVGSGPCGLFAALTLAEGGARPIVLERGLPIPERAKKISEFIKKGELDTECNVQFGEGGAGTYSDGKLKVGSYDKYKMKVLTEFCKAGAAEDIMYSASAHLGTDKLPLLITSIREKIISLGGEFIFSAKLFGIKTKNGKVIAAEYEKEGKKESIDTENIILAAGHSARDVFQMLRKMSVPMQARPFGIGVRIEHPREYINRLQYGNAYPDELPTASYHLVTHLQNGRSVYSFCMCPGGSVVAAASEPFGIVTNGMSEYARDGENSNAAFLVSVTPEDFSSDDPLSGIELQREIERSAFLSAGSCYRAPAERMESFLKNEKPSLGEVKPSYPMGVEAVSTNEYLPSFIGESIALAIPDFDAWMSGFLYPDAVITGPETRSTSPVRILRDEKYEAFGITGLYPAGEGAGYAGGIVSSACDGIRCAEALLLKS